MTTTTQCKECGGPLVFLGPLGRLEWFRCCWCEVEYSFDTEPEIESRGIPDELRDPVESDGNGLPQLEVVE